MACVFDAPAERVWEAWTELERAIKITLLRRGSDTATFPSFELWLIGVKTESSEHIRWAPF